MKNTRPEFIVGNALDVLRDLEDDSVDLVPTSPPYWGLRDYGSGTDAIWGGDGECVHDFTIGDEIEAKKIPPTYDGEWERPSREEYKKAGTDTKCLVCGKDFVGEMGQKFCSTKCLNTLSNKDRQEMAPLKQFCNNCGAWKGQLGLEPTWQLYVEHLVIISREVKRILKPTGSYYLVLGDTYAGSGGAGGDYNPGGMREGQPKYKQHHYRDAITKPKQKLLIPYRVAIALQEDGWVCRNDITWRKPNAMPSSVKDRLTCTTERIFHFVKNAKGYFYDLDAIREPHKEGVTRWGGNKMKVPPKGKGGQGLAGALLDEDRPWRNPAGKNPGDAVEVPYSVQPRLKEFVDYRNLPPMDELKDYLNDWRKKAGYTIEQVEEELDSQAPHHWFNGESYPTVEDWNRAKRLFGFDNTHDQAMTEVFTKSSVKVNNPIGKNPGDAVETRENGKYGRAEISRTVDGLHDNRWHQYFHPLGKNPGDYWSIVTKGFPGAHFAVFPEDLIEPIIKSSCPPDGIVLDPFCGSGTTNLVAMKLGRASIGIDINPDYIKIAQKRCRVDIPSLQDFEEEASS